MSDTLTPMLRAMLERINNATTKSGALLLMAITASGGREGRKLDRLRKMGLAEYCDHPTVMAGKYPADGVRVTDAGRAAVASELQRRERAGKRKEPKP